MASDKTADLGGILAATVIEAAVLVPAARRVVLGLGVTQQQQTTHGAISIRSKASGLMYRLWLRAR
jgi:hypothetical protein